MIAHRRANHVVYSLLKYVTDIEDVKGLGFCVTVAHAEFMSGYFNEHGIPSMFLTGKSPEEERKLAKDKLVKGEVRFIFVVDIYNEGVDIPEVNTVLFLRSTESLTIFLQQLVYFLGGKIKNIDHAFHLDLSFLLQIQNYAFAPLIAR